MTLTESDAACVDTRGAVDPTLIPGDKIDPEAIETQAKALTTASTAVSTGATSIHSLWQGMSTPYQAPEASTLLTKMDPVKSTAEQAASDHGVIADALSAFAVEVTPIKKELERLREEAWAFLRDKVWPGVMIDELNPDYLALSYADGGASMYGTTTDKSDVPRYVKKRVEWDEYQPTVDENNTRLHAVSRQVEQLWAAERTAANKIRALWGGEPLRAFQSEDDPLGYGLDEIPSDAEMPYGSEIERKEGCAEATVKGVFVDFLWEGVVVDGIWGTVEGLGTLALGYNPETGGFFDGSVWGPSWVNLGVLAGGLLVRANPITGPLVLQNDVSRIMGNGSTLDGWLGDFADTSGDVLTNTGKGLIAYDKWGEDPARAAGGTVFNLATIVIPAGAAVTGVKTASGAARVLSKMSNVMDFIDPGAWAVKGGMSLGKAAIGPLGDMLASLKFSNDVLSGNWAPFDFGRFETVSSSIDDIAKQYDVNANDIYIVGDGSGNFALDLGNGKTVPLPENSVQTLERPVTGGESPTTSTDSTTTTTTSTGGGSDVTTGGSHPGGSANHIGGSGADPIGDGLPPKAPDGGPTTPLDPEGRPAVKTDDGPAKSDDGPAKTDDGPAKPDDGPAKTDDGPAKTDDGPAKTDDGPAKTDDGPAKSDDGPAKTDDGPAKTDDGQAKTPGDSGEPPKGTDTDTTAEPERNPDGSLNGPEHRGNPIDPHYGDKLPESGHLDDAYAHPGEVPADKADLVKDPEAKYGRDANGEPYSRAEWESRYVGPNNRPIYPGNDGAVVGTRVEFDRLEDFVSAYGDRIDRLGGDGGDFFSFERVSFEERALPPSNLSDRYSVFEMAGDLPDGVRVEVSQVAPAFGQPGGGVQVRFFDGDTPLSVEKLMSDDYSVIRRERDIVSQSHVDAPSSYSPADVANALDRAPHVDGVPLDWRSREPLDLGADGGHRGWHMKWDAANHEWVAQNPGLGPADGGYLPRRAPDADMARYHAGLTENPPYGYDANGDRLPYANHRPNLPPETVREVWDAAVEDARVRLGLDENPDQLVIVRVTDEDGAVRQILLNGPDGPQWKPNEDGTLPSRDKIWDMGHQRDQKYSDLRGEYLNHQIGLDEFLRRYRDAATYQVEDWWRNRSHRDEQPRADGGGSSASLDPDDGDAFAS